MQKGLIFLKTQHQLVVQFNEQSVYQISGESRAGACPPLFLDQTEAQRAEKNFFKTAPPLPLSRGLDDRTPSLSEGLDEHSNMIDVREMFKSSLYVTKQKA